MRGGMAITPKHPLLISVKTKGIELKLIGVMHKTGEDLYEFIPERNKNN